MQNAEPSEVLFIGGRSGVGKSSVALEVSYELSERGISHAVIEGDYLDLAFPEPWRNGIDLAEQNLAAVWRNYRAAGYSRLIYTNTVSVLQMAKLEEAIGGAIRSVAVLLTATDATARSRLEGRESGVQLDIHVERSDRAARELDASAPRFVHRVGTDGRSPGEVALDVLALTPWSA